MFHSLPFQQVQTRLTLFSKSFAYFPHGPCLLSVSHTYVAANKISHQFRYPVPRNVIQWKVPCATTCTWHTGLSPFSILFSSSCHAHRSWPLISQNNSMLMDPIPMLSLSMFIRHYLWNPMWALILHLLIRLKPVGVLTWYHISNLAFKTTKKQGHAGLQCMQQVQMLYCSACIYSTCLSQHIKTVCLDVHKCHTTLHVNDHLYTDESWSKFACKSIPEASHTFKILLVHRNLQFTMFIALRCTLHGRSSRDIHCWKCFSVCCYHQINSSTVLDRAAAAIWTCQNSCCLKLQSRGRSLSLSKAYTRMSLTTSTKSTRMILPQVHLRKPCYNFSCL